MRAVQVGPLDSVEAAVQVMLEHIVRQAAEGHTQAAEQDQTEGTDEAVLPLQLIA